MNLHRFSFKNEAIWSMIFNLAGLALGAFILLLFYLTRSQI